MNKITEPELNHDLVGRVKNTLYYRLLAPGQHRLRLPRTTVANVGLVKLENVRESERDDQVLGCWTSR